MSILKEGDIIYIDSARCPIPNESYYRVIATFEWGYLHIQSIHSNIMCGFDNHYTHKVVYSDDLFLKQIQLL